MTQPIRFAVFAAAFLAAACLAAAVLYGIGGSPVHDDTTAAAGGIQGFKYLKAAENRPSAPEVAFTDAADMPVALAAFKGRWVVLNLWATWCGPCITELPALARLQAALPKDRVAVVAVDLEKNDAAKVKDFLAAHNAQGLDVYADQKLALMKAFTAYALPLTAIIDPTGHEVARSVGPEAWDSPAAIAYVKGLANAR